MYSEKRRHSDDEKHHSKHRKTTSRPFTFLDYKRVLEKVFFNEEFVEDINDLWLFVKKFESFITKKIVTESTDKSSQSSNLERPEIFNKMDLINLKFYYSDEEIASRLPTYDQEKVYKIRPLIKEDISKFSQLVLMYIDFKQKEKFNKLRKLREAQQNLPVYQFK